MLDVVTVVAKRELVDARLPRLLVGGERLVDHSDPLGPLDVLAGRVQVREVGVAYEGDHR